MAIPLRVLLVEDSENDALLVTRELERGGFDLSWERVETREAMAEALDRGPWDLIISDFHMPRFSAVQALALYRERGIETPFILVSGTVGEEQAVESMKAGASDFFLKDRLTRLCPAVRRELQETEIRRAQRRTEEALRASETRFKDAFAASPIGMALVALDGRWLEVNPVLCGIVGYSMEELLARTFQDITHPDDLEADLALVRRLLSGEIPSYQMEKRYLHKTGREIWVRLSVSLQRDHAGQPQYFIAQIQDITENKRAEQALRLQAAALNAAANSIVITDRAGVIEWVNPAFTRMTGYTPGEALGANPRMLKSGRHDPAFYQEMWAVITAGRTFQGEIVNRRKDGGLYTQELTIAPVHDGGGRVTHFVAVGQDVTDQKRAEEAIAENARVLIESQRVARLGSYRMDLVSGTWTSSAIFDEIFGIVDPAFLRDVPGWLSIVHPDNRTEMADYIVGEVLGKRQDFDHEYRIVRLTDGEARWVHGVGRLVADGEGRLVELIGTIQDITERKLAEEAVAGSLREKEALLKEVHHRVKNNLQIITSLLRIEGRRAASAGTKSVLVQMQDRIQSMALLHETLYRSGNFARVDLATYIDHLAHQLFRSLAVHPGAVRLNLDLAPVFVGIDKAIPCGLIVNELISNSLKHGFQDGRTGELWVRLHKADSGRAVTLSVRDDGVGLPPDFESRRKNSLGMQLISDLARQIQGSLEIGAGPTATFEVTFDPERARATTEIPPPGGEASGTGGFSRPKEARD